MIIQPGIGTIHPDTNLTISYYDKEKNSYVGSLCPGCCFECICTG